MVNYKNIFIDTSIFDGKCYQFAEDRTISQLIKLKNEGILKLYITDIIKDEIINRIKIEVKQEYAKYCSLRILKNVSINKVANQEECINDIIERFNLFLNHVEIIKTNNNITPIIFKNYFNNEPPFDTNNIENFDKKLKKPKKHEFPDAFIIETIRQWAENNKQKAIFLSTDNDFSSYVKKYNDILDIKSNIEELLDDINSEKICYNLSQQIYENNYIKIKDEIEQVVKNIPIENYEIYYAPLKAYTEGFYEPDYEIRFLDYENNLKILDKNVVIINAEEEIQMNIKVSYNISASLEMNDYLNAIHDNEDDIYYNVQHYYKEEEYNILLENDIEILINTNSKKYEILTDANDIHPKIRFYEPLKNN